MSLLRVSLVGEFIECVNCGWVYWGYYLWVSLLSV